MQLFLSRAQPYKRVYRVTIRCMVSLSATHLNAGYSIGLCTIYNYVSLSKLAEFCPITSIILDINGAATITFTSFLSFFSFFLPLFKFNYPIASYQNVPLNTLAKWCSNRSRSRITNLESSKLKTKGQSWSQS